jgi:hypothetical protein
MLAKVNVRLSCSEVSPPLFGVLPLPEPGVFPPAELLPVTLVPLLPGVLFVPVPLFLIWFRKTKPPMPAASTSNRMTLVIRQPWLFWARAYGGTVELYVPDAGGGT